MKKLDDETYKALGVPLPEPVKWPEGMFRHASPPSEVSMEAALRAAPDIAFYTPDEFYNHYTKWFEVTRRDALRALAVGPEYNGGDTPPI